MSLDDEKRAAAYAAVDCYVRNGSCIGLGTGTTAFWAIARVAERIADGWRLTVVASSEATARACRERSIPLVGLLEQPMEVAIDGADEVASDFSLIKGGGGALFREKTVALAAASFIVIVSENKLVERLGAFALPVEVVPFALAYVEREIGTLVAYTLRKRADGSVFMTDNGNVLLDCAFGTIEDPAALDARLRSIHGVVATGLFVGITSAVVVGSANGVREVARR